MGNRFTFYIRMKEMAIVIAVSVFVSLYVIFIPTGLGNILFMSPVLIIPLIYSIICIIMDRDLQGFRIISILFDLAVTFFAILISYGLSWLFLTLILLILNV